MLQSELPSTEAELHSKIKSAAALPVGAARGVAADAAPEEVFAISGVARRAVGTGTSGIADGDRQIRASHCRD
jgi:hypothetical protein